MSTIYLTKTLDSYEGWKQQAGKGIEALQHWLEERSLSEPSIQQRLHIGLETLQQDRITIAVVAEVSRGKTELINSIFFADHQRRLLPSEAGRTTMCPTELFWDNEHEEAYIALLPIETRLEERSIQEWKKHPEAWQRQPLDIQNPESMSQHLQQVVKAKQVSRDMAQRLGLLNPELLQLSGQSDEHIEIPAWRHALVSFPHPLLKQGLSILDTPGLNALGNEPELTLSMLPAAQAVLFIVSADAGVTKTDMELWRHYVNRGRNGKGLLVVLNKIDVLWDELKSVRSVVEAIEHQKQHTAQVLELPNTAVFPVSAQKGLLGKIRNDKPLQIRSGILRLEEALARELLEGRRQIIRDRILADTSQILETARNLITSRMEQVKKQLDELLQLTDKSANVVQELLVKSRDEQSAYLASVQEFKKVKTQFLIQTERLRETTDLHAVRQMITQSRRQMAHSLTTLGLKSLMNNLFVALRERMQHLMLQTEKNRKLVQDSYQRFNEQFGFTIRPNKPFSVMKQRVALESLLKEGEEFRSSALTTMMEQHFVVKRFFEVIAKRTEVIFDEAQQGIQAWLDSAFDPLHLEIRDRKQLLEKRLQNLQKIGRSQGTVQERVKELETQYAELARDLTYLRSIAHDIVGE